MTVTRLVRAAFEAHLYEMDADPPFLSGKLLLAMPGMSDPRFDKGVIALAVHDEEGAIGIGVGQERKGIRFRGLLRQLVAPHHLGTPLADEVQAMSERVGPDVYIRQQTAIMGRIDSVPRLKDIAVPTLVGVGQLDKMTPPELAEEMASHIRDAELVQFPDAAHLPTMENPGPVVEAMKAWLGR